MSITPAIKTLKCQRTRLKSSLARIGEYLENVPGNINVEELKERQERLKPIFDQFETLQSQIEESTDVECNTEERSLFEDRYFYLMGKIGQLISSHSEINSEAKQGSALQGYDNQTSIRLPRITLPEFSGLYEEWTSFHDTFFSLIDSNTSLPNVQKFHYLKSALKGDAREVLNSLSVSNDNYSIAWNMLKDRYDNKRLIIQNHIRSILELPTMTKENHCTLRSIQDGILKHTRALKSLGCPTEHWNDLLVYIITTKMDTFTNKEWEAQLPSTSTLPTLEDIINFLNKKCQTLESISRMSAQSGNRLPVQVKRATHIATTLGCQICSKDHMIFKCEKFLNMTPEQRINQARAKHLCLNCLKSGHVTQQCASGSCKTCQKKHNSLLHLPAKVREPQASTSSGEPSNTINSHTVNKQDICNHVFLSTAIINVFDVKGRPQSCRVLLDSGSQSNFITNTFASKLGIRQEPINMPVLGINHSTTQVRRSATTKIKSKYNNFQASIECLVIEKITGNLPQTFMNVTKFDIPKNIRLADPEFNIPRPIDMLIGATLFMKLLCVGQIQASYKHPYLQKTHFGWVLSGICMRGQPTHDSVFCNLVVDNSINDKLTAFWKLEDYPKLTHFTFEEQQCEKYYTETYTRDEMGRFVVKLPFKDNPEKLGESYSLALKRFYNLERKLAKNIDFKTQYSDFLDEYENLGHMGLLSPSDSSLNVASSYYLPHHRVLRPSSTTTKLRVVFDGSAKTSSAISLNDQLMVGPTIQEDLFSILIRFRTHKVVLIADIAKMYRQILVDANDRRFQRILWRNNPNQPLQTFELSTVTYGTASASYLAIRCLHQLVQEDGHDFSIGSKITLRDFYVDDLITGADTPEEAIEIINQTTSLLQGGGFELRKWCSNDPTIFESANISISTEAIHSLDKEDIKTLGLRWNSHSDMIDLK